MKYWNADVCVCKRNRQIDWLKQNYNTFMKNQNLLRLPENQL